MGTDRQIGFGVGPIPLSSIDVYARRYGYEGDEFDRLAWLIRKMDDAYLADAAKRRPKPTDKDKP